MTLTRPALAIVSLTGGILIGGLVLFLTGCSKPSGGMLPPSVSQPAGSTPACTNCTPSRVLFFQIQEPTSAKTDVSLQRLEKKYAK